MASTDSTSGSLNTLWFEVDVPKFQPLGNQTITTDVCVIGAGFAGITAAYNLTLEGKNVVLLEAREAISGESGRTTAHLMSALDDRFYILKKYHGDKGAKLAAQSHIEAVNIMEQNARREGGDCEFTRVPGYLFAPDQKKSSIGELEVELDAAQEAGHTGASFVDRTPSISVDTGKAICFPNQGRLHPIKYLNILVRAILARGGQIYTHSKMSTFEGGDRPNVKTVDQGTVNCSSIVLAMNNSVTSFELMLKQEAFRTYVIAGVVPKGSVQDALYWDTEDPYHYVRLSPKDGTSDWLISGGEDHRVGASVDYSQPFAKLEQWTRARFPLGEITYKWSGEVFEPVDLLGYLGRYTSGKENVFVITGDSGTGLTHTTIGAKIVTDLIMNRENEYAELYRPSRKPALRAVPGGMKAAFEMSSGYLNWVKTGDISDIEDLRPNTGGVLIKHRKPIACYKDENGKVTQCSAVCTHLSGIVNWNDAEKSWDCPCHGSRFDKYGKCIQGPAIKDLAAVE